ncbi:tetratricopeptide repeat protein [Citromicrobium bathyomarinum]|uniref:tetratricopeptide repeat protein n=1 Tax=Citromicrobium bathyomarinum TaxID=72174 RepID=UPI00315ABAE5
MTGRFKSLRAALPAFAFVFPGIAFPAHAQTGDTVSRAVVQPLPPAAADDLNDALMRLAADRHDVDALIAAGLASLDLDDIDAAIGFLGRAQELSPQNPRIAEGMGAAYVRSGRPVDAIRFFEQADKSGISNSSLWADRGLAYDLVGQNATAQDAYRRALSLKDENSVRQRLALSYAIEGSRQPFEETLRPLIAKQDVAAIRTRAFGLAVLGDADDAIALARTVMPQDMAGKLEPYLRFMPRLTKSQQAAAANLGIYPSASRIGRDDPRIASAAGTVVTPGAADAPLAPAGAQLAAAPIVQQPVENARATSGQTTATVQETPANMPEVAKATPPPAAVSPTDAVVAGKSEPRVAAVDSGNGGTMGPPASREPVLIASANLGQPESRTTQGASLAAADAGAGPAVAQTPASTKVAENVPASGALDLATAFADFSTPTQVAPVGGNVVDISTIKPKREVKEEAAPPPPPAPKRIWLQLGIGQNRNLLRGDWRLKYRKFDVLKGKGPFVTPLGQTNRLLAGPFDSVSAARTALNALAADGIESFVWTSPEGQEVEDLR